MLAQNVFAKIVFEIAPDSVNVVRVILRVVEFHQKCRGLNPIIMRLARLFSYSPA
jgi:hypothetical protein